MWRSEGRAFQAEGRASARTLRRVSLGCGRDGKAGTVAGVKWTREARSAKMQAVGLWVQRGVWTLF